MKKKEIIERIKKNILIPIIRVNTSDEANLIAEILIRKQITIIEITMTVDNAEKVIKDLKKKYNNDIIVGAGTVLTEEIAKKVIDNGAEFILSPCINEKMIKFCNNNNIPVIPGALTPTEIMNANSLGADLVKIFPISSVGGPAYIKALNNVFPFIDFVPTGGVNLDTIPAYLKLGIEVLGIGSELINKEFVNEGKVELVEENINKYIHVLNKYRKIN